MATKPISTEAKKKRNNRSVRIFMCEMNVGDCKVVRLKSVPPFLLSQKGVLTRDIIFLRRDLIFPTRHLFFSASDVGFREEVN